MTYSVQQRYTLELRGARCRCLTAHLNKLVTHTASCTRSQCVEQNVTLADGDFEIQLVENKSLWDQIFTVVDWGFLTAFVIELILKLYAWGPVTYLKNCLDAFDAAVVVISYAFVVVFTSGLIDTCSAGANAATIAALARLVRLVRIFRLMTVMNKIQKSRASAHVLRKKVRRAPAPRASAARQPPALPPDAGGGARAIVGRAVLCCLALASASLAMLRSLLLRSAAALCAGTLPQAVLRSHHLTYLTA